MCDYNYFPSESNITNIYCFQGLQVFPGSPPFSPPLVTINQRTFLCKESTAVSTCAASDLRPFPAETLTGLVLLRRPTHTARATTGPHSSPSTHGTGQSDNTESGRDLGFKPESRRCVSVLSRGPRLGFRVILTGDPSWLMSSVALGAWETFRFAGLCPEVLTGQDGWLLRQASPQELWLTLVTGPLGQSTPGPHCPQAWGR